MPESPSVTFTGITGHDTGIVGHVHRNTQSPEQALAVIELLDDLREVIWCRYELQILDLKRQQQWTESGPPFDHSDPDDVPF